jgi:hypothetical protein
MSLFPFNPNVGQTIQGSENGVASHIPALGMGYIAHWHKFPYDDDANNDIISLQLLASGVTTTVSVTSQDATLTVDPNGATGGDFNLFWNGDYLHLTNAVWTVDVGTSTGGTFTLTYGGQTTSAIPYDASAQAVQLALAALSSVPLSTDVLVTGAGVPTTNPWIITFQNNLGSISIALTGSGASLTGGNHTLTLTNTVVGVGIAWNASAATVQTAVRTIKGLGAATVTGTGPWVVDVGFAGATPTFVVPKDQTTGGSGVLSTMSRFSGTLDVARNVTAKGNAGGIKHTVYVNGTNLNDEVIQDSIVLSGTSVVQGVKAFKTITSVVFPQFTNAGTDAVSIGVGDVLGLHHTLPLNELLTKHTALRGVVEGTEPTVTVDTLHVELNTFKLNSDLTGWAVDAYYVVGT